MESVAIKRVTVVVMILTILSAIGGTPLAANPYAEGNGVSEVQEARGTEGQNSGNFLDTLSRAVDSQDSSGTGRENVPIPQESAGGEIQQAPSQENETPSPAAYAGLAYAKDPVATTPGVIARAKGKFGITARGRWSANEIATLRKVLESLPKSFYQNTKMIKLGGNFGGAAGWVQMGTPVVNITPLGRGRGLGEVVVHEMVHCFQANNRGVTQAFRNKFWPGGRMKGRSVSQYGNTQMIEDMAECGRAYWAKGPKMKKYYPERYEFMKQFVFLGQEFK